MNMHETIISEMYMDIGGKAEIVIRSVAEEGHDKTEGTLLID